MRIKESELTVVFFAFDLIILNLVILFTAIFRIDELWQHPFRFSLIMMHGNLSWGLTYFIFAKKHLYLHNSFRHRIWLITKRVIVFFGILAVLALFISPIENYWSFLIEYSILFYAGKELFSQVLYSYLHKKRLKDLNTNRVFIVGVCQTSRFLRKIIESNPILGYRFVGFLSLKPSTEYGVLGCVDNLAVLIEKHNIQKVIVSLSLYSNENKTREITEICNRMGVRLRFVPENQNLFRMGKHMESIGNIVMINPQEIPLDRLEFRLYKRMYDIVFSSLVILLILSWLIPLMAVLIKLTSKGPVFFVQKRTGINNRVFNCLKFRSMRPNNLADELQAGPNDSRITKIGRFLRGTNLDEFPQFLNVFWGDMSVVGPRPHMLKHTEQYKKLIRYYQVRHFLKPGITGWAQINGFRGLTDELWKMEKRVEYDMEYIKNWRLGWDTKIILKTIFRLNPLTEHFLAHKNQTDSIPEVSKPAIFGEPVFTDCLFSEDENKSSLCPKLNNIVAENEIIFGNN